MKLNDTFISLRKKYPFHTTLCTWILPSLDPLQVAVDGLAEADGEYDGDHLDGRQQYEEDQDGVQVRLDPREHAVVAPLRLTKVNIMNDRTISNFGTFQM